MDHREMTENDADGAAADAETALDFIFLFAIIVFNMLLVIKIICMLGWMTRGRHCLMLSLGIGGLLVVLFAYVNKIRADIHFQTERITHLMLVAIYILFYYLPFVYGFSLVALGVNLAVRRRFLFTSYKRVLLWNAAVSTASWVLGLIVVFPIVFTNIDWQSSGSSENIVMVTGEGEAAAQLLVRNSSSSVNETGFYYCWSSLPQYRATLCVCNIFPLCLAFVFSVALRICVQHRSSASTAASTASEGTGGRLYNAVTESQTIQTLSCKYEYNRLSIQVPRRNTSTGTSGRPKEVDEEEEIRIGKEIQLLLLCSVLVFICCLPWPVFQLLETYYTYQHGLSIPLNLALFWFGQLPIAVLPMIWVCSKQ